MKIAIASGKGGTGKTTFSVNLAVSVKRNAPDQQVILADVDAEEPNTALFFEGEEKHREIVFRTVPEWDAKNCELCGLCAEVCNFSAVLRIPEHILISPELCHSCNACMDLCPTGSLKKTEKQLGKITHINTGTLDIVTGTLDIGEMSTIPVIKRTKSYLEEHFQQKDIILLDCPPGNSCSIVEAVKDTDLVVLVTEPTPFGLHDLQNSVETMKKMGLKIAVVVNKAEQGNDMVEAFCSRENILVLGSLDHSRKYAETIARGELLATKFPEYEEALRKIYQQIQAIVTK